MTCQTLVIIPAYNEQEAIFAVVKNIQKVVPGLDILVIDDGSADNTSAVAYTSGALVVRHPVNLGIGGAVQTGLKFAREGGYEYVVRLDGDGQHPVEDVPALLQVVQAGKANIVFGSRFLSSQTSMHISPLRQLGIRLFAKEVSLLTRQRATDTTSGFMALDRKAICTLSQWLPQDYPEVEGRIILHKAGLHVVEVPTRMRERTTGVSSIDSWRSLYYAFKVSVAVMLTAIKHISAVPEEKVYAPSTRYPTPHSHSLQLGYAAPDYSSYPKEQIA